MGFKIFAVAAALAAAAVPAMTSAAVYITEYQYKGTSTGIEFFELTNTGDTAIDITGWVFKDESSSTVAIGNYFGSLAAHESVIVSEESAAAFRSYWGLAPTVRVYGNNGVNLGKNDQINIYNSSTTSTANLMDKISDVGETAGTSCNRGYNATTGAITSTSCILSTTGDVYGSHRAGGVSSHDLGNPGSFPVVQTAAVPEPATWALMILGFGMIGAGTRRRARITAIA